MFINIMPYQVCSVYHVAFACAFSYDVYSEWCFLHLLVICVFARIFPCSELVALRPVDLAMVKPSSDTQTSTHTHTHTHTHKHAWTRTHARTHAHTHISQHSLHCHKYDKHLTGFNQRALLHRTMTPAPGVAALLMASIWKQGFVCSSCWQVC